MIGIGRVMQRLGTAAIRCPDACTCIDQELGYRPPKGRRRHVQCRIALIEVMGNVGEEEITGILSRRARLCRCGGELGIRRQPLRDRVEISGDHRPDEVEKISAHGPGRSV